MQAVILAGGLGTRFSEQTQYRPKPMIEIGGAPYPLAYYENIRQPRNYRVHHLLWLQRLFD